MAKDLYTAVAGLSDRNAGIKAIKAVMKTHVPDEAEREHYAPLIYQGVEKFIKESEFRLPSDPNKY